MNLFDLRLYDPEIGRWTTVDPEKQYPSPYNGNGNNPVINYDPTGGENPVHGSDGKFRGYDSEGVKGEIIVYDGEFRPGMSHEKILKNGGILRSQYLNSEVIFAPSFPDKIDLANDSNSKVFTDLINWSIYINESKGKNPNGEPITLADIISEGAKDERSALTKFFDWGAMNGTNNVSRNIKFRNGSYAEILILDPNFQANVKDNAILQVYYDIDIVPNTILFQSQDGRSTIMSIKFSDHTVFHYYANKIGL